MRKIISICIAIAMNLAIGHIVTKESGVNRFEAAILKADSARITGELIGKLRCMGYNPSASILDFIAEIIAVSLSDLL